MTKPQPTTIRGKVGPRLLDKADRLFRNDDYGVFIEVLQNARRAGATRVAINIEAVPNESFSMVTVEDNGSGIEDFQMLATFGDSEWAPETIDSEDPAGMGFYSLCHSDVEVHSGHRFVHMSCAVFLGKAEAVIEHKEECVRGTRLRFRRTSLPTQLTGVIERATKFYPLEVWFDGTILPRHDFLAGALHRELIDGIEVGFATHFEHDETYSDLNWNFYGARLHYAPLELSGLLPSGQTAPLTVRARFQVLETTTVKLQLPERKGVFEDDAFREFQKKAGTAAYRFFQRQPQHVLCYANWREANQLGVVLPEAAYLLDTWHAPAQEDYVNSPFEDSKTQLLPSLDNVILVEEDLANAHTLEGALNSGATVAGVLYKEKASFVGYRWYDKLPKIVDATVFVDQVIYDQWVKKKKKPARPQKLDLEVTIEQADLPDRAVLLPAYIHVDTENCGEVSFVAVASSPWDNESLTGPFDLSDFLFWATFQPSDDCEADSWDTQEREYRETIERQVNHYFRGPKETLIAMLRDAIDWEADQLAEQLGVAEIRFQRSDRYWKIELISPTA